MSHSRETIRRILSERYLTLATVCDTGSPWGTPVFYGVDSRLQFIFISAANSLHAENIRRTGEAAWTIILAGEEPANTDGLIFRGTAEELSNSDERTQAFADTLYDQRFPNPAERSQHPADLASFEDSERRLFVLRPEAAFMVDKADPRGVSKIEVSLEAVRSANPRI